MLKRRVHEAAPLPLRGASPSFGVESDADDDGCSDDDEDAGVEEGTGGRGVCGSGSGFEKSARALEILTAWSEVLCVTCADARTRVAAAAGPRAAALEREWRADLHSLVLTYRLLATALSRAAARGLPEPGGRVQEQVSAAIGDLLNIESKLLLSWTPSLVCEGYSRLPTSSEPRQLTLTLGDNPAKLGLKKRAKLRIGLHVEDVLGPICDRHQYEAPDRRPSIVRHRIHVGLKLYGSVGQVSGTQHREPIVAESRRLHLLHNPVVALLAHTIHPARNDDLPVADHASKLYLDLSLEIVVLLHAMRLVDLVRHLPQCHPGTS